jgi:hypothetical protein
VELFLLFLTENMSEALASKPDQQIVMIYKSNYQSYNILQGAKCVAEL